MKTKFLKIKEKGTPQQKMVSKWFEEIVNLEALISKIQKKPPMQKLHCWLDFFHANDPAEKAFLEQIADGMIDLFKKGIIKMVVRGSLPEKSFRVFLQDHEITFELQGNQELQIFLDKYDAYAQEIIIEFTNIFDGAKERAKEIASGI